MNLKGVKIFETHYKRILSLYAQKNRSTAKNILASFGVMIIGLALMTYFNQRFDVYVPTLLILISVITTIISGPFLGFFTTAAAALIADYTLIVPIGKILTTPNETIRIGFTFIGGMIISLFFHSIQKESERFRVAKLIADKVNEEAIQAKLIADKVKEEAIQAKVIADKALKDRDEMIGIISHELKNPLTNMQLSTTLLLKILSKESGLEKVKDIIEKLSPSIQRMNRLVSDLLDVTRIEAKALKVDMEIASLDKIAKDVLYMYNLQAKEKSIKLRSDIAPNCQQVLCDQGRTSQILSNLVGNALKFTDLGGSISIHAKKIKNMTEICVTDTGIGITEEHLPHVFDRFWQEKNTAHIGTGLGLPIAKGLTEAQGGKMWVKSQPGIGTTFYFTLLLPEHDQDFIQGGRMMSKGQENSFNRSPLS
jgi:signal transduction histidine kinase